MWFACQREISECTFDPQARRHLESLRNSRTSTAGCILFTYLKRMCENVRLYLNSAVDCHIITIRCQVYRLLTFVGNKIARNASLHNVESVLGIVSLTAWPADRIILVRKG